MSSPITAARRLVDSLIVNGTTHVFCVPGESYLAVLDALSDVKDQIKVIACRHEAGAANMAEAYGKLAGRPAVCTPTLACVAPGPRVTMHTPGRPVSLP